MRRAVETVERRQKRLTGSSTPRIAPPLPLKHEAKSLTDLATQFGQPLYPWQRTAGCYLTARYGAKHLYPEVAVVVARQQGKTSLLDPLLIKRLLAGRRVMHTAQNRDLPRDTHERLAELIEAHFPDKIAVPRGITFGSGKEGIKLTTGGRYRIVAPTRSGARGQPNDDVVIDEVLDMEDFEFVAAAKPTLTASKDPQIVYLSNAGHAMSAVLNALRARAGTDPSLAYLEWSAAPERSPDDVAGWCEANPAIGHNPATLENLEREYRANVLGGTMHVWEQEHLCRWTVAKTALLVTAEEWTGQLFLPERPAPVRPVLGIKMDPSGDRVSGVLAWQTSEGKVTVDVVVDVTGDPVDVDTLGPKLKALAKEQRVGAVAFDPQTDADLARHLDRTHAITQRDYASATERFVRLVAGRGLTVHDPEGILAADLEHTTKRAMSAGTAIAVKAGTDMTNTAAEAAIRAIWKAADATPRPAVY